MFSVRDDKLPIKTPFYYGWVILGLSGMGLFFSGPGQTYSISVFINSYIADFGWSRTFVSSLYSAGTIVAGLLLFTVGKLVDRYGQRKMMAVIGLLMAMACLFNSMITNAVTLFIGFFLIRLFGQGSMTLTPGTLVPQWFVKKRGLALSIMSIGSVLGSAVLPPFNTWIINTWGWDIAWRIWAGLLIVVFVPLATIFIRNTPEQVGLIPDGAIDPGRDRKLMHKEEITEEFWTLKEASKTRAFWFISFCQAVPSMVNTGLIFHFISVMATKGIDNTSASLVLSTIALVSFPTMFVAGYVMDRIKVHKVLCLTFICRVFSMFVLIYANSLFWALCFGVLHGILAAFEGITGGYIWPHYFGRMHLGSIRGAVMTVLVIASALGPLPFGYFFDLFGRYTEILFVMMLFPILASIAAILSPKPKWKDNLG